MFGIDSAEFLIIAVVALVVIGPKDLPRVMRAIGNFMGRARGMARHFRSGIDAMVREAEIEEMTKEWQSQNERIMREHPNAAEPAPAKAGDTDWGKLTAESRPAEPKTAPRPLPGGTAPPIPPSSAAARPVPSAGAAPPPDDRP